MAHGFNAGRPLRALMLVESQARLVGLSPPEPFGDSDPVLTSLHLPARPTRILAA